jgi:hypothetical protein
MKQIFIFSDSKKDNISYYEKEPVILVSMRRSDLPYLKEQEFSKFSAVYILIGENNRYIGQAAGQTIFTRLSQHFASDDKSWVDSIIFFSRSDGKLSKADTDYLEKRLIDDFKEKSEFDLTNSTIGNNSYIDKLQKAKSNQLYDVLFEIIDDIANLDLFGNNEDMQSFEESTDGIFEIKYSDIIIKNKSARGAFINFVAELLKDKTYEDKLKNIIIDDSPSFSLILGRRPSSYKGRPNSCEVADGIWLYTNFNRKNTRIKIEKLAKQLNIKVYLKWY